MQFFFLGVGEVGAWRVSDGIHQKLEMVLSRTFNRQIGAYMNHYFLINSYLIGWY
jgi:hypothetical protein